MHHQRRRHNTMTLPLHPLDPDLFARALPLLDEEWLTRDPELAPVLPTVLARNVGQDWHKAGTFRHHLVGVTRTLTVWQQPRDVRLLGLLHSVYGNAFVDLVKFDPAKERARVREIAGESAEHLVYLFCTQSRTQFVQKVLAHALEADGSLVLQKDGQDHVLTPYEVAAFIIVSMADTIEQWFSWQDDIFSRFPDVQHRHQKAGPGRSRPAPTHPAPPHPPRQRARGPPAPGPGPGGRGARVAKQNRGGEGAPPRRGQGNAPRWAF